MTTFATAAGGPQHPSVQGPPPLPRLVGPTEGWEGEAGRPGGSTVARRSALPWRDRLVGAGWSMAYVLTSVFTGIAAMVLAVAALAGFFSLPAMGAGVLLLSPAIWGAWGLARGERHRIAAFLGVDIGPPPPSTAPPWRKVLGIDEPRLKALGWAGLHSMWGVISAALVLFVLSQALLLLSLPLWGWSVDRLRFMGLFPLDQSAIGLGLAATVGLALLLLTPLLTRGLSGVDVALARWLIGTDPQAELRAMSHRVQTLTTTRTETLDSVEAERRRIERDLHDGPQQRLVSVAMNLGLARDALERNPHDPEAARLVRELLDEAHASSKEAITEMRQVARGIVPPILTDRGLDAAVSALADRSPVPVTVVSRLPAGRLEPTTEAVAYFCVSEALTNIAKHSGAQRATVELATARGLSGELLAITVTDDGRGGAVLGAGSGLTGLRQRLAAVDGQVHVHSPVGTGTTVSITLPLRTTGGTR